MAVSRTRLGWRQIADLTESQWDTSMEKIIIKFQKEIPHALNTKNLTNDQIYCSTWTTKLAGKIMVIPNV